jgi:hypothetical protein
MIQTAAFSKYRKYAQLVVYLDGFTLRFSTPPELDHFLDIMSRRLLPRGPGFIGGRASLGLPNNHWLSRLPKKCKTLKYRSKITKLLSHSHPLVRSFSRFYENRSFSETDGLFDGAAIIGSGDFNDPYRLVV